MHLRHELVEISRQEGYISFFGDFILLPVTYGDEAVTCITEKCTACNKERQRFLKGHVKQARKVEPQPIPQAFIKGMEK